MAPSLRRTAPSSSAISSTAASVRDSSVKVKSQKGQQVLKPASALKSSTFGRVTKAKGRAALKVKFSDVQKGAFEEWCGEDGKVDLVENVEVEVKRQDVQCLTGQKEQGGVTVSRLLAKRKRGEVSDCESESESQNETTGSSLREQSKKRCVHNQIQLLSPPASRDGTDCDDISLSKDDLVLSRRTNSGIAAKRTSAKLPQALLDIISMHAAFLKALSLHYAHNGSSSPAELGALMDIMTRLWKKESIRVDAVQRMLATYEIAVDSTLLDVRQVEQRCCPFKIVRSGLGLNVRTNLEYIGQAPYNEANLQAAYIDLIYAFFEQNPSMDDCSKLPRLTISLGMQTSVHRAKAASTRAEILGLSAAAQARSTPDFSKLSITDPSEHTPAAVKSRTLSLFDRVRAKGLASASNAAPSPEQIARRHAIGRISEVVEFLRMKQQQKLSIQFHSSVRDSPGKIRGSGKVSFSLGAIVRDIRQSVTVPICAEEIKICLRMLSQEIPGDWCRIIELGSVVSVTLCGNGMSGNDARRMLEING